MAKRALPEVNAGSMADIAFLLLIFFLVTTTIEKDKGILRRLPELTEVQTPIHERNIMEIIINAENEIWAEGEIIPMDELTDMAIAFIDNGGITTTSSEFYCAYCKGDHNKLSSDHPKKAVISISTNRAATYKTFIAVQDQLSTAYNILRNTMSQELYDFEFTTVKASFRDGTFTGNEEKTKAAIKHIQELYPLHISEAETKKTF